MVSSALALHDVCRVQLYTHTAEQVTERTAVSRHRYSCTESYYTAQDLDAIVGESIVTSRCA